MCRLLDHWHSILLLSVLAITTQSSIPSTPVRSDVAKQIFVSFRYDDFSEKSPTELENRIFDAFRSIEAKLTVGVIPFVCEGDPHDPAPQKAMPLSDQKAELLGRASNHGCVEVALHGYSHQTVSSHKHGEFIGLSLGEQVRRLQRGKDFLETATGAKVRTFIPPWNRYDADTIKALQMTGFEIISASVTQPGYDASPELKFLPASCGLRELRNAVEAARHLPERQVVIVVLFHPYDFEEVDSKRCQVTWKTFETTLQWLKGQQDIKLVSIEELASVVQDTSKGRLEANRILYWVQWFIPKRFVLEDWPGIYLPQAKAMALAYQMIAVAAISFLVLSLTALLGTCLAAKFLQRYRLPIGWAPCALMFTIALVVCFYILRDLRFSSIVGFATFCVMFGIAMGVCWQILRAVLQSRQRRYVEDCATKA